MTKLLILSGALLLAAACTNEPGPEPTSGAAPDPTAANPAADGGFYAGDVKTLEGEPVDLAGYRGSVSLVVNVASRCGYTGQYAALQKLHDELSPKGFQVLAFPSNDFGGQEPGTPAEIREFCATNYSITFPVFEKVATKGDDQAPVYARLKTLSGELPSWNFCKYLIGKDGECLGFWKSGTRPDDSDLRTAIEAALES